MKSILIKTMAINAKYGSFLQVNIYMSTYATSVGTPLLSCREAETDEPLWTLSSNLLGYRVEPDEFCTFFKTYAENEGLLEILTAEGLVTPTGRSVDTTHAKFPEVKINTTAAVWDEFTKLCQLRYNDL
jgi:hypothetical protein